MTTARAFAAGSEFPAYQPGTVRLYSMRFCPYAHRARIVLAHKNIKYETVNINLKNKPEWFLKDINPLGLVPALQIDDKIVYESLTVSNYLDEIYPENRLNPSDPYQRARDSMLAEVFEAKVIATFYKLYLKIRDSDGPDKEMVETLNSGVDVMEAELKRRDTLFYGGDKPMMIDFTIWTHMERVFFTQTMLPGFTITAERYPKLKAWEAGMLDVPAVKCTVFPPELFVKYVNSYKSDGPVDYDVGLEE